MMLLVLHGAISNGDDQLMDELNNINVEHSNLNTPWLIVNCEFFKYNTRILNSIELTEQSFLTN